MFRPLLKLVFIGIWLMISCDGRKTSKQEENISSGKVLTDTIAIEESRAILRTRSMGLAYLEDNKLEEAEEAFKRLIELAPDEALGYANLGIVYMRMGDYEKAEEQLTRAVELSPDDPDIRLNLARVFDMADKEEASREELEKNIEITPDHVQTLYSLAEAYQNKSDEASLNQWESYLRKIVDKTPANLVARLYLAEVLTRNGNTDEALKNLEETEGISPAFPDEAVSYYEQALADLRSGRSKEALTAIRVFHNLLKLTNNYQSDIQQLKGTSASRVGTPVISFSNPTPVFLMEGESLLDAITFTDATASSGLVTFKSAVTDDISRYPSHFAVTDMDRDGDQDIYLAVYDASSASYRPFLLQNDMGRFNDIAAAAGIRHGGIEQAALFADRENDGFLDLYIVREGPNILYANVNEGIFVDVTETAGAGDRGDGNRALFFDLDQEGDLDLLIANESSTKVFRNRGDGIFSDLSDQIFFSDPAQGTKDAVLADFDDDGDVDVFLLRADGTCRLFMNLRESRFGDLTEEGGLADEVDITGIASGDYNNDGFADLLILPGKGLPRLYKNKGDGSFRQDQASDHAFNSIGEIQYRDASFFDFDNDGHLDMIIAGIPVREGGRGLTLWHNTGHGMFEEVTHLLPAGLAGAVQVETADYNEDGDLDIYFVDNHGGLRLLRNDGGNANHHLKIQLVGIRTGSGKNNYFGIGAKVEVRVGELYQMKTVTHPNVHFGLGDREKVDVVRILWTNGVPQNIFSPGSDQDLIEEQELKGSCPFLYTWNGEEYVFQKDMMWRSALGMPLGIMSGSTAYAFANASEEYLKIRGDALQENEGRYTMQITAELWETIYFDELKLFAVDHPDDIDVFVNERFAGPPFPDLRIYETKEKQLPRSVKDEKGRDLMGFIREKDDRYVAGFRKEKYQGITEMHDMIIEPGESINIENISLFLRGWIFPTDASINAALSQAEGLQVIPPFLQLINKNGNWETVIDNIGFPMGKDKTVVVDLGGKFLSGDHRIRIRTTMEIYWDQLFFSEDLPNNARMSDPVQPLAADLHYRGFSRMFRKGGRYGPHWFDYQQVSENPKWRDLAGYYTRYGDVKALLTEADDRYIIMNAGDEVTVAFDTTHFPQLPYGWKRDFLIYSVGWVKDGDLNTAHGHTVEPYPFHGIKQYPYEMKERPVILNQLNDYIRTFNTREVTNREFRNEIREFEE